ncbi:hypothetical protein ACHAWF_006978 [Thalassiosira exigua]
MALSASAELQRAVAVAEERRISEIERITKDLDHSHAVNLEKAKSIAMEASNSSQRQQLEQLASSHREEMYRVRSEMEVAISQAVAEATAKQSASHVEAMDKLRTELEAEAEKRRITEIELVSKDLNRSHTAANQKMKSEALEAARLAQSQHEERLATTHTDEVARMRSELDKTSSDLLIHKQQMESMEDNLNACASERDELLKVLKGMEEALSFSTAKQTKAEERLNQMIISQKEKDSIEDQITSHISNKDALMNELEKTSLQKDLKRTKEALAASEGKHAAIQAQLKQLNSDKADLPEEFERVRVHGQTQAAKQSTPIGSEGDVNARPPQDMNRIGSSAPRGVSSLIVDTSGNERSVSPESVTPLSARSSSSAIVASFSKFDNIKHRYLKKMRESPKA